MKIISVGKNTKNAEGVKIPGEIKKAFTRYLKAQQYLHGDEYEKVSVELLFASWLATFEESEEYKAVIAEADEKKQAEKDEKKAAREEKKAAAEAAKAEKKAAKIAALEKALAEAKGETTEEAEAE